MSGVVVTCEHCGASLPSTAMFCGECGSAVAPSARASTSQPDASPPVLTGESRCSQCGAPMRITDIFCAECGHVAQAVAEAYLTQTRAIGVRATPVVRSSDAGESAIGIPEPGTPDPGTLEPSTREPAVETAPIVLSERESAVSVGGRIPADKGESAPAPTPPTTHFVLQFSTGEQAAVTGGGLLGRNPQPEPGEQFEHLVVLHDPGRSVSKTHLEFGHEDGWFWVLDRYSGNGSVLRQPELAPVRCEPGRRYRAARGSRIDIGEQFFVVS